MGATRQDIKRERVAEIVAILEKTRTVGDPSASKMAAAELGMDYQMVCYYLRGSKPLYDRRASYDEETLRWLMCATPSERAEYAKEVHRSPRAVDAACERFRKLDQRRSRDEKTVIKARIFLKKKGYFDFTNHSDLKAIGMYPENVRILRRELQNFGLAVRAPNILYHPLTKRRYFMVTMEQLELLKDPKHFLRHRAAHIRENWVQPENNFRDMPTDSGDPEETTTAPTAHLAKEGMELPTIMGPKYRTTGETRNEGNNITLYRIERSNGGEQGGWVESESNLSQFGDCWVGEEAVIFGNAQVTDDAVVAGHARVYGEAVIANNAFVSGRAIVKDEAKVVGFGVMKGNAYASGKAVVEGSGVVSGYATLTDDAVVTENAKVFGEAHIFGQAVISGKTQISGDMNVHQSFKAGKHVSWKKKR